VGVSVFINQKGDEMKKYIMMNKGSVSRFVLGVALVAGGVLFSTCSYAADKNFTDWALSMIRFIDQMKYFVSVVATIGGMWFVFTGLSDLKNHHSNKGNNGDYVRHGTGKCFIGACLIGIVPMTQMIGSTVTKDAGSATTDFHVDPISKFAPLEPSTPASGG
jgi:hypothetical protein